MGIRYNNLSHQQFFSKIVWGGNFRSNYISKYPLDIRENKNFRVSTPILLFPKYVKIYSIFPNSVSEIGQFPCSVSRKPPNTASFKWLIRKIASMFHYFVRLTLQFLDIVCIIAVSLHSRPTFYISTNQVRREYYFLGISFWLEIH